MLRGLRIALPVVPIVLFLLSAVPAEAGGYCRGTPVTDGRGITVEMRNSCFTPTVLHIQPGESVTWVNRDPEAHMVSGANVAWGNYDNIAQGQSVRHQFKTAGAYPYYCFLHNGMIGAVIVGDGNGSGAALASVTIDRPVPPSQAPSQPAGGPGSWPAIAVTLAVLGSLVGYGLARFSRRAAS